MSEQVEPHAPPSDAGDSKKKPKHLIYVDILEVDEPLHLEKRVKKVACLYSNGDRVIGKKAETMPHPEHRISAKKQEQLMWESSSPFLVRIDARAADAFVEPQPWKSHRRKDGVHFVSSGLIRADHATLVGGGAIEGKYTVVARQSEQSPDPRPDVEELDPHFIIDP